MTATPNLARFGQIVRSRREELGIQQEDLDQYGGPSSTTLSRIERGIAPPSAKTLRKLDVGLRWATGSAARTLDGGEPAPSTEPDASASQSSPTLAPPQNADGNPYEDIDDLIDFANRITGAAEMFHMQPADELFRVLHPAVRFISIAAQTIGTKMRREDGIMDAAGPAAAEWLSLYAGYLEDLAALSQRVREAVTVASQPRTATASIAQDTPDDAPPPLHLADAARTGVSVGQALRDAQDEAGEAVDEDPGPE